MADEVEYKNKLKKLCGIDFNDEDKAFTSINELFDENNRKKTAEELLKYVVTEVSNNSKTMDATKKKFYIYVAYVLNEKLDAEFDNKELWKAIGTSPDYKSAKKVINREGDRSSVRTLVESYKEFGESYAIRLASTMSKLDSLLYKASDIKSNITGGTQKESSDLSKLYEEDSTEATKTHEQETSAPKQNAQTVKKDSSKAKNELDKNDFKSLLTNTFNMEGMDFNIADLSNIQDKIAIDAAHCALAQEANENRTAISEEDDPWKTKKSEEALRLADNVKEEKHLLYGRFEKLFTNAFDNAVKETNDKLAKGEELKDPLTGEVVRKGIGKRLFGAGKDKLFKAIDDMPLDLFTLQFKVFGWAFKGLVKGTTAAIKIGKMAHDAYKKHQEEMESAVVKDIKLDPESEETGKENTDNNTDDSSKFSFTDSTADGNKIQRNDIVKKLASLLGLKTESIENDELVLLNEDESTETSETSTEQAPANTEDKSEEPKEETTEEPKEQDNTEDKLAKYKEAFTKVLNEELETIHSDLYLVYYTAAQMFNNKKLPKLPMNMYVIKEDRKNESLSVNTEHSALHSIMNRLYEEETEKTDDAVGNEKKYVVYYGGEMNRSFCKLTGFRTSVGNFQKSNNVVRMMLVLQRVIDNYYNLHTVLKEQAEKISNDLNVNLLSISGTSDKADINMTYANKLRKLIKIGGTIGDKYAHPLYEFFNNYNFSDIVNAGTFGALFDNLPDRKYFNNPNVKKLVELKDKSLPIELSENFWKLYNNEDVVTRKLFNVFNENVEKEKENEQKSETPVTKTDSKTGESSGTSTGGTDQGNNK